MQRDRISSFIKLSHELNKLKRFFRLAHYIWQFLRWLILDETWMFKKIVGGQQQRLVKKKKNNFEEWKGKIFWFGYLKMDSNL